MIKSKDSKTLIYNYIKKEKNHKVLCNTIIVRSCESNPIPLSIQLLVDAS